MLLLQRSYALELHLQAVIAPASSYMPTGAIFMIYFLLR